MYIVWEIHQDQCKIKQSTFHFKLLMHLLRACTYSNASSPFSNTITCSLWEVLNSNLALNLGSYSCGVGQPILFIFSPSPCRSLKILWPWVSTVLKPQNLCWPSHTQYSVEWSVYHQILPWCHLLSKSTLLVKNLMLFLYISKIKSMFSKFHFE